MTWPCCTNITWILQETALKFWSGPITLHQLILLQWRRLILNMTTRGQNKLRVFFSHTLWSVWCQREGIFLIWSSVAYDTNLLFESGSQLEESCLVSDTDYLLYNRWTLLPSLKNEASGAVPLSFLMTSTAPLCLKRLQVWWISMENSSQFLLSVTSINEVLTLWF